MTLLIFLLRVKLQNLSLLKVHNLDIQQDCCQTWWLSFIICVQAELFACAHADLSCAHADLSCAHADLPCAACRP